MPEIAVPWAQQELLITLPDDWKLQQVAAPQLRAADSNWPDRLATALGQPESSPPLSSLLSEKPNPRITLIVEDITHHSPLPEILDVVLREIRHARVDDENVQVVFASGLLPPVTKRQAEEKLGQWADKLRWSSNPWDTPKKYVDVGTSNKIKYLIDRKVADADVRIIISAVTPHIQAGFGGGLKMIVPGCSHLDTIASIHKLAIGRAPQQLLGVQADKNRMRQGIDALAPLLDAHHGKTFAVQYMLDQESLPIHITAGDPIVTQQMLAKQCSVSCGIITHPPLADVLITNAYPRDHNLWQTFKAIANTRGAVRPNGVIICLSRCQTGLEDMNLLRWPVNPTWTRRIIRWIGAENIYSYLTRLVPRLAGNTAFFLYLGLQVLQRNPLYIVSETLHGLLPKKLPGIDVFATVDDALTAVRKQLGNRPQRVSVFPDGATTFPVPTPGPTGRKPE